MSCYALSQNNEFLFLWSVVFSTSWLNVKDWSINSGQFFQVFFEIEKVDFYIRKYGNVSFVLFFWRCIRGKLAFTNWWNFVVFKSFFWNLGHFLVWWASFSYFFFLECAAIIIIILSVNVLPSLQVDVFSRTFAGVVQ